MTFDNEPGSPPKSLLYWSGGTYPLLPLILFLKNLSAENQIVESSASSRGGSHFATCSRNTSCALSHSPYLFRTLPAKRDNVLLRLPSVIGPPTKPSSKSPSSASGSVSATTSIMLIQPSCQITSPVVAPNKNLAASRALSSKNG